MKIRANYHKVLELKGRLRDEGTATELTQEDVDNLLQILSAAEGDIFPSLDEIDIHQVCMERIEKLDPKENYTLWQMAMDDVRRFENKYC